jgi:HNH endonuclease
MPSKPSIPRVCETCGVGFLTLAVYIRKGWARFCSKVCAWDASVGLQRRTLAERLAAKTDRSGECWIWTGKASLCDNGYGQIRVGPRFRKVHRVAWELAYGPIPDPYLFVCHRCDVRLCVRPEHLFLGTHQINQRDKVEKGRHVRGMTAPRAKLTDDQVREIRRLSAAGRSRASLGREYGIGNASVSKIVLRQRWAHI